MPDSGSAAAVDSEPAAVDSEMAASVEAVSDSPASPLSPSLPHAAVTSASPIRTETVRRRVPRLPSILPDARPRAGVPKAHADARAA